MKYVALVLFLLGGLMVACNIQLAVAGVRNRFDNIDRSVSMIPVFDTLLCFLGVKALYYGQMSFLASVGIFVGIYVVQQFFYYLCYRTTLKVLRLRHDSR